MPRKLVYSSEVRVSFYHVKWYINLKVNEARVSLYLVICYTDHKVNGQLFN